MANRDIELLLARALRDVAPHIVAEPRPQPALRVGGIGRRKIAPEKFPAIDATLRRIFAVLQNSAQGALQNTKTNQWFAGPLDCAVITPLAEGADRLIARAGLAENWRLGAVLPFPQAEYEQTFDLQGDKTAAISDFRTLLPEASLPEGHGVFVLDGKSSSEDERLRSYRDGATAIIHRSDFVIAIVEHVQSLSETGSSVREAVALRVPLILVHPETPDRFRLVLNGKELPENQDQVAALADVVRNLFPRALSNEDEDRVAILDFAGEPMHCAVKSDDNGEVGDKNARAISDFESTGPCRASTHAPFWIQPVSVFNRIFRYGLRKMLGYGKNIKLPVIPKADASTLSFDLETATNFARLFMQYHRADQAATAYAELLRGAYVVQALLATAVGFASAYDLVSDTNVIFSVLILALLLLIIAIIRVSDHQHWQERWIDYRLLAEVLRAGMALLVAGKISPLASTREHIIKLNPNHWVSRHATNVLRSLKIAVPGRTLETDPQALDKAHGYINSTYIGGQVKYHAVTAEYESKLGKMLKVASRWIGYLIIALAVANVFYKVNAWQHYIMMSEKTGQILIMLLIILPALAAVLLSLRGYNQFEVVSLRSGGMAVELAARLELERTFDSFHSFGDHVLEAAQKILRDVEGWIDIFITRRMET